MKKCMTLCFLLGMLFVSGSVMAQDFAGGTGTALDPYQITTPEQLGKVTNDVAACYKLMNDIDMQGIQFAVIGSNTKKFSGTFDGNGKKISNLTITAGGWWGGFVSYLTGTVKNVYFKNYTMNGKAICGGIAGIVDGGSILNCALTGTVAASGNQVGGITGGIYRNAGGMVKNCYVDATVKSAAGMLTAGGLIGCCETKGFVQNCIFAGRVEIDGRGAGIAAFFGSDEVPAPDNTITGNVLVDAVIKRTSTWGGPEHYSRIIGSRNGTLGTINNNFAVNVTFEGLPAREFDSSLTSKDGMTKTESEVSSQAFYSGIGYEFGNTEATPWVMPAGAKNPVLWFASDVVSSQSITQNGADMVLYPVPTTDNLNCDANDVKMVEVFNDLSQLVLTSPQFPINLSSLASGKYYVRVSLGDTVKMQSIIKQ